MIIIIVVILVGQNQDHAPEVRKEATDGEVGTAITGIALDAIAVATAMRETGGVSVIIKVGKITTGALAHRQALQALHLRLQAAVKDATIAVGKIIDVVEAEELP